VAPEPERQKSERQRWFGPALALVAAVTAARLLALIWNRTDLFVDESQYWLWGQNLDFGYYSKPPLIAWVIRAATTLAGSDAPFWVRMPGALFHGATALILAALVARIGSARAAIWTAAAYVTTPFTAVGSLLISTDTIMAPAYAAAIWGWLRLAQTGAARHAVLTGVAVGLACMAKYAGAYFFLGAALSALVLPRYRVGWWSLALLLASFLAVLAPNIVWNQTHQLQTVAHTLDNIGWVRGGASAGPALHPGHALRFVLDQFAVLGPVLFAALLVAATRRRLPADWRMLALLALPPLLIVTGQAFLSRAYANWALAAYFAGLPLAVLWLTDRMPRLLPVSLAINGAVAVLLPLLTILAPWPGIGGAPLMKRYLGRAELSRAILAAADQFGAASVYASDRDILADLFYTGRGSGLTFYAPRRHEGPRNYYEEMFPLPDPPGPTLYVLTSPPICGGAAAEPVQTFTVARTANASQPVAAYLLPDGCTPDMGPDR
jgi:4-amino-4-deoxy-L-arabinose transferase-like glycosyltransferase